MPHLLLSPSRRWAAAGALVALGAFLVLAFGRSDGSSAEAVSPRGNVSACTALTGEAARACAEWLRGEVRYVPGSTGVHTVAKEAWDARAGVCQDLAHLTVGLLRGLGVPARYVSGYLHPAPEAGIGETVTGQSHAWVEWWDGAWTPYDPTNGKPVGVEHVVVARGRDYWDVPPHKGVYAGPGGTSLSVEVDVTRVA